MELACAALGAVIIAGILWEVFEDLFHPAGTGALSDWLGPHLFRAMKLHPPLLPVAGPLAVVTVIGTWVASLVVGFGLVYLPWYPAAFRTSTGTVPSDVSRVASSLYFSFETLITLGYGDLVPHSTMTRLASTLEALVGFGLLTASVSSIVLLYPALSRMRLLARGTEHLVGAEGATGAAVADSGSDVVLNALARDVTQARIDLVHFPIVYFFATNDPKASVATWLRHLVRFASEAQSPGRPNHVRVAGGALDKALTDFAELLDERYLHTRSDSRERIFDVFARDHLLGEASHARARIGSGDTCP
jgi:hypothetical protein